MVPDPAQLVVDRLGRPLHPSPLVGEFLPEQRSVAVSTDPAELALQCRKNEPVPAFLESGQRQDLFFDPARTTLGIVTCGGLCPGLNDVIRAVTRTALRRYGVRRVLGFRYGYSGLVSGAEHAPIELTLDEVADIHLRGGSLLGVSRGARDPGEMIDGLVEHDVDALIAVGGDGTLRGVHALCEEIDRRGLPISVVGVPKTIDNDIGWVQRSFGLDTAVAVARDALLVASTEARSAWGGIGLVRLMGRESGFITTYASLASGVVDFCLIPEAPFAIDGPGGLLEELEERLHANGAAVIAVAEGSGADLLGTDRIDGSGNRIPHDIGLHLRDRIRAALPERGLQIDLKYIDPSYTLRGVEASANDAVFCVRLGQHAVHAAMAGFTDVVIGNWSQHFTLVPTGLATAERQRVDLGSSLWRNVQQLTGQRVGTTAG